MPAVEVRDRPLVFRAREMACRLVPVKDRSHRLVQLGAQISAIGNPARNAWWRAAEYQAVELGSAVERVLQREPAAPRVAEQVQLLQSERLLHGRQFLNEPADRPQGLIIGALRSARTELVVKDDRSVSREVGQVLEIIM